MATTSETIRDAAALEANAGDSVEAALAESARGRSPFSISLLLDAAQKERESLNTIEESLDTLRGSLLDRRRALDQQEEALRDLSETLIKERE